MNDNRILETIKRTIKESDNLDGITKLDALVLLDTASRALPIKEGLEIIGVLEDLYQKVNGDDYKEALLSVIDKYRSEIRSMSCGVPEETVTLEDFLKPLKIPVDNIPREILDLKLVVGMDDGMGYTPRGFMDVIDSYPDTEKGVLRIWV